MTENYPMCMWKKVRVRVFPEGEREIDAVCFGDLAVARRLHQTDFTIYHLPSGYSMAGAGANFRYEHMAVSAMMDVGKLKNRLMFENVEGFREIALDVRNICAHHGGHLADGTTLKAPDDYDERRNGYSQDAD